MRFQPGHFSCEVKWQARFALHPRLRGSAHGITPGLAYLRQALETFAVTNRINMFVFKDPKLNHVFYLRYVWAQSEFDVDAPLNPNKQTISEVRGGWDEDCDWT